MWKLFFIALLACVDAQMQVYLIVDATGSSASEGKQFEDGLSFSMPMVNSSARPAYVTICDSKSSQSEAEMCVQKAAQDGAHVIVAGTSKWNSAIIDKAQAAGIPNIHLSGGNPAMWKAENTFATGLHVPFITYTKPIIEAGVAGGLKHIAILRTAAHGFSAKSCISALKWAMDSNVTVMGPSKSWCEKYGDTAGCRLVADHCVCGTQEEVNELAPFLGGSYNISAVPTFYQIDERNLGSNFALGDKVDKDTVEFVQGIIGDLVDQGANPVDMFVNFAAEWHSVIYALYSKNYAPKLLMGWQGGTSATWAKQTWTDGKPATSEIHGYWTVGYGQWHKALVYTDPVFGNSTEATNLWKKEHGSDMDYNSAAGVVAGVLIGEIMKSANFAELAANNTKLAKAIREIKFTSFWGPIEFNAAGQATGRDPAAWQVIPKDGVPMQLAVLPKSAQEAPLYMPFPEWCSGMRGLCPPGVKATCKEVRLGYKQSMCCGAPKKEFKKTLVHAAKTCGHVKKTFKLECCGKPEATLSMPALPA